MGKMGAYLVGTPSFEAAFNERDVAETFQNLPMGNSRLSLLTIGRIYCHLEAVVKVTAYVAFNTPFISRVSPNEGGI